MSEIAKHGLSILPLSFRLTEVSVNPSEKSSDSVTICVIAEVRRETGGFLEVKAERDTRLHAGRLETATIEDQLFEAVALAVKNLMEHEILECFLLDGRKKFKPHGEETVVDTDGIQMVPIKRARVFPVVYDSEIRLKQENK